MVKLTGTVMLVEELLQCKSFDTIVALITNVGYSDDILLQEL